MLFGFCISISHFGIITSGLFLFAVGSSTPVASVSERFQSPVSISGLTKKRLFLESPSSGLRTVKPGQSLLQNQQSTQQLIAVTTAATNGQIINQPTNSLAVNANNTVKSTTSSVQSTKFIPVQGKVIYLC